MVEKFMLLNNEFIYFIFLSSGLQCSIIIKLEDCGLIFSLLYWVGRVFGFI